MSTTDTFPTPHPEGSIYDPAGYELLMQEQSREYERFRKFQKPFFIAVVGCIVVQALGAILGLLPSTGWLFSTMVIAGMASGIVYIRGALRRAESYRRRLAEHEVKVALAKDAIMSEKSVTNTVTVTLGNGSVFNGPLLVGQNIKVSYATAQEANNDQLGSALKQLVEVASGMIQQISDAELKVKASEQLKTMTEQAIKPSPSKWLLEVSSTGLIEAAKTVAQMATPVASAVKAVLALVAGAA